ncbi:hypothetical protein WJX81_001410 [Elliptochloris bilobata]|uniref:Uncharacterized protein n=1 Tax=Elliptochloris bilobata TaxID=381761 RepID=A0AAW1S8X5_9CHLO
MAGMVSRLRGAIEYVVRDQEAADKLLKQWFYTKLSRIPGTAERMREDAKALAEKWPHMRRGELSLTEVATYLGFTAELYAWFCVGEIIGRGGTLTGYSVK